MTKPIPPEQFASTMHDAMWCCGADSLEPRQRLIALVKARDAEVRAEYVDAIKRVLGESDNYEDVMGGNRMLSEDLLATLRALNVPK